MIEAFPLQWRLKTHLFTLTLHLPSLFSKFFLFLPHTFFSSSCIPRFFSSIFYRLQHGVCSCAPLKYTHIDLYGHLRQPDHIPYSGNPVLAMSYCYLIQGKCLTLRNEFPYEYVCEVDCKPVCTSPSSPCEVPCDPCGTPCPPIAKCLSVAKPCEHCVKPVNLIQKPCITEQ